MDIKFIFHLLAIICTILAAALGATSSNNRIILIIVFLSIAGIFELAIPFLKGPFHPPNPVYNLRHTKDKYNPGLKIHGITWEKDFLLYEFTFSNTSKKSGMEDVRLKFEIPGSYVSFNTANVEGMENINLSADKDYFRKINPKTETIIDTINYRTNMFTINMSKVRPNTFAKFNLIFQKVIGNADVPNYFTIKYSFIDENKEKQIISKTHAIVVGENKDNWEIDATKELSPDETKTHAFSIAPINWK